MKKFSIIFSVLVVLGGSAYLGVFLYNKYFSLDNIEPIQSKNIPNPQNATYTIDGATVTLVNGISETPSAPGSSTKIITKYFGNSVSADLNKDGNTDIAFILSQETGGSGLFYYFVALMGNPNGAMSSDAVYLGDRISPQSTTIDKNNVIVVNYADRKPGEPFTTSPSVGKSIWLKFDPQTLQFGEVMQNFEGEADPDKMMLDMKSWIWSETIYNNDPVEKVAFGKMYSITFQKKDRTFSATTDCNSISGKYVLGASDSITLSEMASTQMFCQGSQESKFSSLLERVEKFKFTSKGELYLILKFDEGTLVFK